MCSERADFVLVVALLFLPICFPHCLRGLALFPLLVALLSQQILECAERHTLLKRKILCALAHQQYMGTMHDFTCQRNWILDQFNACYGSYLECLAFHDARIHFNIALISEARPCACVVNRVIFQRTYGCFNGIEGRPTLL